MILHFKKEVMNNIFQEELQTTLTELQTNLGDLKAAKEQIKETKSAAARVIEGMDTLKGSYESYLEDFNGRVDGFLSSADREMRTKINDGVVNMRETALEILNLHKEKGEEGQKMVDEAVKSMDVLRLKHDEQLLEIKEKIQGMLDTSKTNLEDYLADNKTTVDGLTARIIDLQLKNSDESQELIANIKGQQAEHLALLNQRNEESTGLIVSQTEGVTNTLLGEFRDQMTQMREQFNQQNEQVHQYLTRFEETLLAVQKLEASINAINFPEYFKALNQATQQIHTTTRTIEGDVNVVKAEARKNLAQQTRETAELFKAQNEQLKSQRTLLIVGLVFMVLLGFLILFKDMIMGG